MIKVSYYTVFKRVERFFVVILQKTNSLKMPVTSFQMRNNKIVLVVLTNYSFKICVTDSSLKKFNHQHSDIMITTKL